MTADKMEKQLSTKAGRLRESLLDAQLARKFSMASWFEHFCFYVDSTEFSSDLYRCKNKRLEAPGFWCVTTSPSTARTDSDSRVDGRCQSSRSSEVAAVARRRKLSPKQKRVLLTRSASNRARSRDFRSDEWSPMDVRNALRTHTVHTSTYTIVLFVLLYSSQNVRELGTTLRALQAATWRTKACGVATPCQRVFGKMTQSPASTKS